jgi:recombination protein RecT
MTSRRTAPKTGTLATRVEAAARREDTPSTGDTIFDLVKRSESQFARALPRHIDAGRFVRTCLTTLRTTPGLAACTPQSILAGLMQAAQLGVEVNDVRQQSYLVPRWNAKTGTQEASFQLGYRGMIDLAARGGIIVDAHDVCENDEFWFEYGLEPNLIHRPLLDDRGPTIGYYAVARFADASRPPAFRVIGRQEAEGIRDSFAAGKKRDGTVTGPWVNHFDAMARKTVIRRLLNYLPLPIELAEAVDIDRSNELGQIVGTVAAIEEPIAVRVEEPAELVADVDVEVQDADIEEPVDIEERSFEFEGGQE